MHSHTCTVYVISIEKDPNVVRTLANPVTSSQYLFMIWHMFAKHVYKPWRKTAWGVLKSRHATSSCFGL